MAYRIDLTKSAIKELDRLSAKTHDKIIQHLVELEQNPRTPGAASSDRAFFVTPALSIATSFSWWTVFLQGVRL